MTGGELCDTCVMSPMRGSPWVKDTAPPLPKVVTGLPVAASSMNSRWRLLSSSRSRPCASRHTAVPRSFQPLPDSSWPSS